MDKIFKDTKNAAIVRVNTTTASTAPMESRAQTH